MPLINKFVFFIFLKKRDFDPMQGHYEAWSYKKKKHKKIQAYRKSV